MTTYDLMEIKQEYCKLGTTCNAIPLEKRKIIKKNIRRTISSIFLILFFYIFFSIFGIGSIEFGISFSIIIFILVIILAINYIWEIFYFKSYFYDIGKDYLMIKKGVISRGEIHVLYNKIQDVYLDQDFLDRLFGLYDVHLETAGFSSGMEAHIDGVNEENSKKLRDILMSKVKKNRTSK